jgi:hypothetical protein
MPLYPRPANNPLSPLNDGYPDDWFVPQDDGHPDDWFVPASSAAPSAAQPAPDPQSNAGSFGVAARPAPRDPFEDFWSRVPADRLRAVAFAPPVFAGAPGRIPSTPLASAQWDGRPIPHVPPGMLFGGSTGAPTARNLLSDRPDASNTAASTSNLPPGLLFGGAQRRLQADVEAPKSLTSASTESDYANGPQIYQSESDGAEEPWHSSIDFLGAFLDALNPIGPANAQDNPPPVGLIGTLQRLLSTGRITPEQAAIARRNAEAMQNFENARLRSAVDGNVSAQTWQTINSREFAQLRSAYQTGQPAKVTINGRTIRYEPGMPPTDQGISDFQENGFTIGPSAFRSKEDEWKTVLQELYRLNTTQAGALGGEVSAEAAAFENEQARAFVNRVMQQPKFRRAIGLPN